MNPVKNHAALLNRHADLIDEIYRLKSVSATPDTENALGKLESARILFCDEDGAYRLHPIERNYLNNIYDKTRVFDAGSPIAIEVERLRKLLAEIKTSAAAGDETQKAAYEDETIDTIFDLQIRIDDQVRIFDMTTRNGYHDARSMSEKLERNAFYQERARDLTDAVDMLNGPVIRDLFAGPYTATVRARFSRRILDNIEIWSTRLAGLIREMLEFMYRTKLVEARTKRYRAIVHALDNVSPSEQVEALGLLDEPMLPVNLSARPRFDVRADANEGHVVSQARKLDPYGTTGERRKKHAAGTLKGVIEHEVEIVDPVDQMIDRLIASVRETGESISVRRWAGANAPGQADGLVMDIFDYMADGDDEVSMTTIPEASRIYTCGVRDVILAPPG